MFGACSSKAKTKGKKGKVREATRATGDVKRALMSGQTPIEQPVDFNAQLPVVSQAAEADEQESILINAKVANNYRGAKDLPGAGFIPNEDIRRKRRERRKKKQLSSVQDSANHSNATPFGNLKTGEQQVSPPQPPAMSSEKPTLIDFRVANHYKGGSELPGTGFVPNEDVRQRRRERRANRKNKQRATPPRMKQMNSSGTDDVLTSQVDQAEGSDLLAPSQGMGRRSTPKTQPSAIVSRNPIFSL